jgi:hypothetical protein
MPSVCYIYICACACANAYTQCSHMCMCIACTPSVLSHVHVHCMHTLSALTCACALHVHTQCSHMCMCIACTHSVLSHVHTHPTHACMCTHTHTHACSCTHTHTHTHTHIPFKALFNQSGKNACQHIFCLCAKLLNFWLLHFLHWCELTFPVAICHTCCSLGVALNGQFIETSSGCSIDVVLQGCWLDLYFCFWGFFQYFCCMLMEAVRTHILQSLRELLDSAICVWSHLGSQHGPSI